MLDTQNLSNNINNFLQIKIFETSLSKLSNSSWNYFYSINLKKIYKKNFNKKY